MRHRSRWLLLLAAIACAIPAIAFAPRVARRIERARLIARMESADSSVSWPARRAIIELPRDELDPILPRLVAAVVDDFARGTGADVFVVARLRSKGTLVSLGATEEIFEEARVEETLRGAASDKRRFSFSGHGRPTPEEDLYRVRQFLRKLIRDGETRVVVVAVPAGPGNTPSLEAVVLAPLDEAGDTLRLIRERSRSRPR